MLGVSDEELKEAEATGEFLGRPLEEIGQMSYRQLKEELRRRERDLERARRQRDKAESALSDLQEENQVLREGPAPGARELSPLERDFTQLILACARLLGTAQDAPEEELVRDGQGYLSRLMQEVNLLSRALYPFEIPAEPFGGADQEA